jgi:hypothetical protein
LDIETQIWDVFFDRRLDRFDNRTLGELFGFNDIEKLWKREDFDRAAIAASEACRQRVFHAFEDFLKDLYDALAPGEPVPKASVRNPSANYALAQLRWFSEWLEYRFISFKKKFLPAETRFPWLLDE